MTPRGLIEFLALLDRLDTPADAEFLYDESTAAGALRRHNLAHYLSLMRDLRPTVMLVAEAPGYRGATITGVPFMSARELSAAPGLITGNRTGDGFRRPPDPIVGWEASSAAVWRALAVWHGPLPLLWGIYPNHPFESARPRTNRAPRPAEVRAGAPIALELARAFGITTLAAVGRKAQGALAANGVRAQALRHPAQGGALIFAAQLAELNSAVTP